MLSSTGTFFLPSFVKFCSGQPVIGIGCHLFVMQSHSCLRICSDL